ncbi:MAG: DegV family protein, partial [Streptococcus gallolyticus]|nr:DegV family protein [Streptococcus gallolyticus]
MALLDVKNLTKNFGGLTAVGDVTMHLNEGELVGLIGATLKIKPLIVLKEGEIFPLGIAFTRKQSIVKVLDHLKKHFKDDDINVDDYKFVVGTGYDQTEHIALMEKVKTIYPNCDIYT